jgi:four helix bundle protein
MNDIAQQKSFAFSIRIFELSKYMISLKKEYSIANQILRSGTSIGANIEEATGAQSKKDFIAKYAIAYKEARETSYWLRLLKATNSLEIKLADSLLRDCEVLIKITGKTISTVKSRLGTPK